MLFKAFDAGVMEANRSEFWLPRRPLFRVVGALIRRRIVWRSYFFSGHENKVYDSVKLREFLWNQDV